MLKTLALAEGDKIDLSALGFTDFAYGAASGTTLGGVFSASSGRTYVSDDSGFEFAIEGVAGATVSDTDFIFI